MEVAGGSFPRTVQAGGKTLVLNGAGLRQFLFKVYAIGLYLEHPASDAATILRRTRCGGRATAPVGLGVEMGDAIADAFNTNAGLGPQLKGGSIASRPCSPTQAGVHAHLRARNQHRGRPRPGTSAPSGQDFADVLFSA
jgi:hypothetical protein